MKYVKLSPFNMGETFFLKWFIHDLLDVINNHTKFQLNQMRTKFSFKPV